MSQGLATDRSDTGFEMIDTTETIDEANKYGVRSVPATIVLADNGSVVLTFDGLTQADIIEN